jgi:hypothetical protein
MRGEVVVVLVIIGLIFGAICAAIAAHKGRNPVAWFFVGLLLGFLWFVFGIIGVIIIASLPNENETRRRDQYIQQENRRLREQLMQEQIKAEAFRRHTMTRLDTHDNQLGVDTRSIVSALPAPDGTYAMQELEDLSGRQEAFPHPDQPQQQAFPQARPAEDFFGPQAQAPVPQHAPSRVEVVHPRDPKTDSAPRVRVGPTREWHYEYQGSTRGPVNDRQLVELAREGQIVGTTLIWTEQLGDWKPAQQVKALQPYLRS